MCRSALIVVFLMALLSDAAAQWKILSERDRLNEKTNKYAALAAKTPDRGITAILTVHCSEDKLSDGKRTVSYWLRSSRKVFSGSRINGAYRIDDRASVDRYFTSISPTAILLIAGSPDLSSASRFRVQLESVGQPSLLFDFDLTGIAGASRAIGCD